MMFRTKDGTYRYPEVMALRCILNYAQYVALSGYVVTRHEERDALIEDWLSGKVKLAFTVKEAEDILKEYKEMNDYVR